MPRVQYGLQYEMEDGRVEFVVADQRDFAKWEVQPQAATEGRPHTKIRFLTWSAATRQQLTKLSFAEWDEHCVEAGDRAEGEGEQGTGESEPGQSVTSGGS